MFDQITILGPGLLGASIGMAVRERGLARRIVSWSRRAETRANCLNQSWCSDVFDCQEAACKDSQLVIVCTPVHTIVPLLMRLSKGLESGAVITDVGSTKSQICREAKGVDLGDATFIGSHPMAGSEQTGMANARADLFQDAACMVTPLADTPVREAGRIAAFWEALGMQVTHVSPERHDEIVAHVSHLPHLLASALCSFLAGKDPAWKSLAGRGLFDTTRIASGETELWRQILESNREEVVRAINGLEEELHQIKSALINGDSANLKQRLERGKHYRDQL